MLIGFWYCDFYPARRMVCYWTHGPRKCNESQLMVPGLAERE